MVLHQRLSVITSTRKHILRTLSSHSNYRSDIDLFLYGLDETAAKKKMEEIYESIKDCSRADTTCIRSTHTVTIVCQYPQRYLFHIANKDISRLFFACTLHQARFSLVSMSTLVQWVITGHMSMLLL